MAQTGGTMNQKTLSILNRGLPWVVGGTAAMVVAVGALMTFMPIATANAEKVSFTIDGTDYYIDIAAEDVALTAASDPAGKFTSVSTDVVVHTNSGTGYQLYLGMDNNNENGNRLYNTEDSTVFVAPHTATTGHPALNTWGFSMDNTDYQPVPLAGQETRIKTSAAQAFPSDGAGDSTTVYYGLNVDTSLPNGTYEGTVVYTAVADASTTPYIRINNLTTNDQYASVAGGDKLEAVTSLFTTMEDLGDVSMTIGGTPCANVTTSTSGGAVVVTCNSTPNKTGVHGNQNLVVNIPKFNKTYTTSVNMATIWDITNMQDMTATVCKNTATPATSATSYQSSFSTATNVVPQKQLKDVRDNKQYYIKKLADGNCWMDQNLDLDLGTPNVTANTPNTTFKLTSETSDINYNDYKHSVAAADNEWTPPYNTQLGTGTSWAQNGSDGAKSFTFNDNGTIDVKTGGTDGRYWNGASSFATTGDARNHFGNYYNWPAATAGTGTDSTATDGTNVGDSICPKGWQLPQNSGTKSFNNLIRTVYGISATNTDASVIAEPLHFIRSGYYNWSGGTLDNQGTDGSFWSATAKSDTYAYYLGFHSGGLDPQHGSNKGNGLTVRCVAR